MPVSPAGIQANGVYGVSTNQMMYNGSPASELVPGDQLFFRPTQSEFVLLQFGDLAAKLTAIEHTLGSSQDQLHVLIGQLGDYEIAAALEASFDIPALARLAGLKL